MKSWAQGLKQWALWLFGEGAMPGTRARIILAATVVVVALLGVGTAWAVQPQGNGTKSAASSERRAAYELALKDRGKKHHDKKAGSGSKVASKKKKKKSDTTSAKAEREAAYRKAVALALANRTSKNHKHSGKGSKAKKAKKGKKARNSSITGSSLAAAGSSSLLNSPTSVFATTNVTGTGSDNGAPGAPSAPDLSGATSGHRGSRP